MPVYPVADQLISVHPFDISAILGDELGLFIHALLVVEPRPRHDVTATTELTHFHMGPPLESSQTTTSIVGSANLSLGQVRQIQTFVDERRSEKEAEDERRRILGRNAPAEFHQYWLICDAVPPNPDFSLWRFSCVGFVRQSYREAGIELLAEPFPERTIDELKRFYPHPRVTRVLDNLKLRERLLGLGNGDKWPVCLVGYLVHSLARSVEEINGPAATAYQPVAIDSHFPHQTEPQD
ncbi:MAG: hypothetical protein KF851_15515 [Pirellulaceae bacterium]|nr:hypothetical protein [Pirellulaceae bacterium]